jgi:hypothetical protein
MNYRTLFLKTYVAFLMTLVLVSVSFANVTVSGTTQGNTDGEITSFGFNNPTDVSGLILLQSGAGAQSFTETTSLTRAARQQLQFEVRDIDGFDHLDVYVVIYKSDNKTVDSGIALQHLNSGVSDDALVLRWIAPERSVYLSGLFPDETFNFTLTSGVDNFLVKSGSTPLVNSYNSGISDFVTSGLFNGIPNTLSTWSIDATPESTEIESGVVSVYNGENVTSSGVRVIKRLVTVNFQISKVLPRVGSLNYAVIVYDRLQQETSTTKTGEVYAYHADNAVDYDVQFYGEISIDEPNDVVFSGVAAGSGFKQSEGLITATFISNDSYKQSFSADTTWLPDVVTTGLPEFAFLIPNSGLQGVVGLTVKGTNDPDDHLRNQGNRFALNALRNSIETLRDDSAGATEPVDLLLFNTGDEIDKVISSSSGAVYVDDRSATPKSSSDREIAQANSTSEPGIVSTFRFEIRLSPVFQTNYVENGVVKTTVFTGSIRLLISNVS